MPAQREYDSEPTSSERAQIIDDTTSEPPPMHQALSDDQLHMRKTLPPAPMVGNARELLELAGDFALDQGDARASQRATQYRGGAAQVERLNEGQTDRAPPPMRFHFREISEMTDSEVDGELTSLIFGAEGANVERRILLYLVRRHFGLGLAAYGPVKLHDGRDNTKEMREEVADFLFYWGKEQLERQCRQD